MVRVRFAPSPTGNLHIGGARTALFNYIFAKQNNGSFILRMEDTDLKRSSAESEKIIMDGLRWLGIDWDEGVDKGGDFGPYRSMERLDIYKEFTQKLLEEGKAYYCCCTQEELEKQREDLIKEGKMPRYTGKCRDLNLNKEDVEKEGREFVIRFKVPENETIVVEDLIRGKVEFDSNGIGDFVIVKSDGIPVYNFAVAIDDSLMEISHIIRGEEHLSNTPRQVMINKALGFENPKFAHVSLILGKDRTKMSKRHGSTWVEQYKNEGYLPEAIINFLALLGWSPEGEEEIFSLEELIKYFSFDRVAKNPAVFDMEKLKWMNSSYIRNSNPERITDMAIPYLVEAGFITEAESKENYQWLKKVIEVVKDSVSTISEIPSHADIFFKKELEVENDEAEEVLKQEHLLELFDSLEKYLDESGEEIEESEAKSICKKVQKETGVKGKKLFMPIRVLLTGKTHGPEIPLVFSLMGKTAVKKRIDFVKEKYILTRENN